MSDKVRLRVYLRPSEKDVEVLVNLWLATFAGHTWRKSYFPRGEETEEEERAWRVDWKLRALENDPTYFYVVAYEDITSADGTVKEGVIGWTSWTGVPEPGHEKTLEQRTAEREEYRRRRPDVMDKEMQESVFAQLRGVFQKCLDGSEARNYWVLQVLAVHPKHQRKGVATKMVRWGIEEAAKDGKGVIVIATPVGRPFYASVGFEAVAELKIWDESFPGMVIRPPVSSAAPLKDTVSEK